jgi:hypothetical protein
MKVCDRCGNNSGAITHETNTCAVYGPSVPRHLCCPGNCQLNCKEEIEGIIRILKAFNINHDAEYLMLRFYQEKHSTP